jgi:hypothetical protein
MLPLVKCVHEWRVLLHCVILVDNPAMESLVDPIMRNANIAVRFPARSPKFCHRKWPWHMSKALAAITSPSQKRLNFSSFSSVTDQGYRQWRFFNADSSTWW